MESSGEEKSPGVEKQTGFGAENMVRDLEWAAHLRKYVPLRFSDLFSLAEEYEDSSTKPPKSRRKAALSSPRSRKNAAQPPNAEEESGSSSASVSPIASVQEEGSDGHG